MCGHVCGFHAVRFVATCATAVQPLEEALADSAPAGLAPLFLTVSESQLHTISAVGAGLLIGTALGVILPEGSEAFRAAQEESGILLCIQERREPALAKHQGLAHGLRL